MPKQSANKDDFLKNKKVFTTTEARRAGITKSDLRKIADIVCFGSFPIQTGSGIRIENIWTCDKELSDLTKIAKKVKKSPKNADKVLHAVQRIEEIVRDKLGFNIPSSGNTDSTVSDSKQTTGENNDGK